MSEAWWKRERTRGCPPGTSEARSRRCSWGSSPRCVEAPPRRDTKVSSCGTAGPTRPSAAATWCARDQQCRNPNPAPTAKNVPGVFVGTGRNACFRGNDNAGKTDAALSRARHAPIRPFHASRATFVAVYRPRRARARSGVRPRGGDSQSATSGVHGHTRRGGRERLPLSRVATRLLPRLHRGHRPRCASASIPFHARVARETFASTSQPAHRARNAPPGPLKTGVSILRSDVPRRRARGRPGTLPNLTSPPLSTVLQNPARVSPLSHVLRLVRDSIRRVRSSVDPWGLVLSRRQTRRGAARRHPPSPRRSEQHFQRYHSGQHRHRRQRQRQTRDGDSESSRPEFDSAGSRGSSSHARGSRSRRG